MKVPLKPFDANGEWNVEALADAGLRRAAVRSVGVTVLSGGLGLAIQVISVIVLARLLTPKDFGLVTMATTFSLLLLNFGLNGITEAVVQRETVTDQLASNLFWINVGGSFLLAILFAASGPLLARIYHDPLITGVSQGVAVTIFLTGPSVVHLALLKRAMRFTQASFNDIVGRAILVVVSIALAWLGWGYWALVAGLVAQSMSLCLGSWFLCRWMPRWPQSNAGTRPLLSFATHTYGRFSTGYFTNNLDNFLVGWRLGPASLGFYKKAYDLFVLPTSQLSVGLTIVAVAALSRLQRDLVQYRRYLLRALSIAALLGMGLSADLTLVGKDLVAVLLGTKWQESGRLFTLFGPGIGVMLLYGTHIWIHLSLGRADRWFRWGLVDLAVTTLFLVTGLHWGAEGIAVAWVAAYWVLAFPALWYAGRPIGLGIGAIFDVVWRYMLAAALAGGAALLAVRLVTAKMGEAGWMWALARLSLTSIVFTVLYLTAVVALHRSLEPVKQVVGLVAEMIGRSKTAPVTSAPDAGNDDMNRDEPRVYSGQPAVLARTASENTV